MNNTNDLYAQYILGQAGQRGQRGAGMGARIMQQATDGKPIPHWGGVLAKALTGAIGGYVDAQDDARGQERQDALLGQLAARDASQAAEARQFMADRLMPPGSQGATQQAAMTAPVPVVQREPAPGGNMPPPDMMPHFEAASRETGVPVQVLIAQAAQESGFRPDAVGRSGENGMAQIMPSTGRDPGYGVPPITPEQARDPAQAAMFQARYLAARGNSANGGATDWNNPAHVDAALGAYNGGGDPNYVANVRRRMPGAAPRPAANPDETLASNGTAPPAGSDARPNGRVDFMAQADALHAQALEAEASPNPRIRALAPGFRQQAQMMERRGTQDAAAVQQQALREQARAEREARDRNAAADRAERERRAVEARAEREANKPVPAAVQRAEDDDLQAIGTASTINGELSRFQTQIRNGVNGTGRESERLTLSPVGNAVSTGRNFIGASDANSTNYASFRAGLERLRNESLRLNTGVQTDGDAQRAWNELITNINDPAVVQQRLAEIQALNAQAMALREAMVANRRTGARLPAIDLAPFRGAPAATGRGAPGAPDVGTIEGGYRFRGGDPSRPGSWERVQ